MRIGYARVSTQDQNLDLQRDARRTCVRSRFRWTGPDYSFRPFSRVPFFQPDVTPPGALMVRTRGRQVKEPACKDSDGRRGDNKWMNCTNTHSKDCM
jgi:hypothetical protein